MGFAFRVIASCAIPVALAMIGIIVATYLTLSGIAERQQEDRILFRLENLRTSIEANLSLGFQLAQIGGTQDVLERARSTDSVLQALDVFSGDGVSVYSTDRGVKGEPVPAEWRAAATTGNAEDHWRYEGPAELVLGLPIRNDLGDVVGHIVSITSPEEALAADLPGLLQRLAFWIVPVGLAASMVAALALSRRITRPYHAIADALAGRIASPNPDEPREAAAHAARRSGLMAMADLESATERLEAIDHAL
ncbi:hypothetical protein [Microvirga sp. TS319]|uniref:hypothetical protein n=1 Tax=Microvirga sp. TS319 TaxID=3241165 RepID=UPI00351A0500